MGRLLGRLGSWVGRRPWWTVGGYLALLVLVGGAVAPLGAGFSDEVSLGATDSQQAADLLWARFPAVAGDTATVVFHADSGLTADAPAAAVERAVTDVEGQPEVAGVTPVQLSPDRRTGFVTVQFTRRAADLTAAHLQRLEEAIAPLAAAGVEGSMRGPVVDRWRDRPVPVGEAVGLVAALVLVTLLFRSWVATAVTVGAALLGLALGNTLLALVSAFVDIPTVAPTIAVMLGLGAGVDYALFLVARVRSRLRAGDDVVEAVTGATSTTGAAVVTAGAIVVVSICGLYVTGITVIGRMGLAAALVVTTAALTTVTLVPALCRLAGPRLLPRRERDWTEVAADAEADREGRWARAVAVGVARRPWLSGALATTVLLALAAPALGLELGQPDDGNRPSGDTMRVAYDRLTEGFGPGFNGPLLVAIDLAGADDPGGTGAAVAAALRSDPAVASVTDAVLNKERDAAIVTAIPATAPQDAATSRLVADLRDHVLPEALSGTGARAFVGGQTATFDDLTTLVRDSLVLLIVVVVGVSLILLTLAFRSVVIPLVSALLNLLSIAAAYGVVTLAFQTSWGTDLLGVAQQPVVSFVPMLMFAILFGLSMDYNVFLLTAVREARAAGHDARAAVPVGVGRTASLITTAGVIMTIVFLGFAVTPETEVTMIGLGLATAVLVDVTVVRLVLAPAVLELLGERAWWLPRWLGARLPEMTVAEH
ncbi:MAG: MMPL family transporter [Nocardioidaceae bacterium]